MTHGMNNIIDKKSNYQAPGQNQNSTDTKEK